MFLKSPHWPNRSSKSLFLVDGEKFLTNIHDGSFFDLGEGLLYLPRERGGDLYGLLPWLYRLGGDLDLLGERERRGDLRRGDRER